MFKLPIWIIEFFLQNIYSWNYFIYDWILGPLVSIYQERFVFSERVFDFLNLLWQ